MKVKFLMESETDVFAFFPEDKYNPDPNVFWSYSHVGQHSGCHIDYANECKAATPEQYEPLLNELKQIYDNLEII